MNLFKFTLKNLRRQTLATVSVVVPVGRRALGKVAMERRLRSALGGRLGQTPAPAQPLKVVILGMGPVGTFNEPAADQAMIPVSENGALRVVFGPVSDHRRRQIETRYRLKKENTAVSPCWDPSAAFAESLTTWLVAA